MFSALRRVPTTLLSIPLVILILSHSSKATTATLPSDEKMIVEARAIVRASVLSVGSSFDDDTDQIFTYINLRVREVIKGDIKSRRIVLKEMGGWVGDRFTKVFGTPEFIPGEEVLLYLGTWSDGSLRVHQMFLGKFSITIDARTGERTVVRDLGLEGVNLQSQSPSGAVTNRASLSSYLAMVRKTLAANLELSRSIESIYYANVPMLTRPPAYEPLSKKFGLQLQFRLFSPAVRWFEPDTSQNVVFMVNSAGAPAGAVTDVSAAMNAWSTVSGSSLRVVNGGETGWCASQFSGPSVVVFDNCDGRWGGSPCQNILALGGWSGSGSQTKVINGRTFFRITQGFVSFNPFSCSFDSHCDVQLIATHELGHALGLHHSWDPIFGGTPTATERDATMYYLANFDGRCAGLRADDIAGIRFVYPGASAAAGTDTIGLYNPVSSFFFLRNTNSSAPADLTFSYGPAGAGWTPLAGDWNGDGVDTIGLFNPASSTFFLRNSNSSAPADLTFGYGPAGAGWLPIAGDWNGDGVDTIGLYNPASSTFFLRNSNTTGVADLTFNYGPAGAGWRPVSGDWNGDNTDTIGLYNPTTSMFFLRNSNSSAPADLTFSYGPAGAGWTPVVGDWNGDGTDTIGLYNPSSSMFFLRNTNSSAPADLTFSYGPAGAGWRPVIGDWNGS